MDNQQGTLNAYIAGLWDGEGSFSINQYKQKNNRINTRICISVANTDRNIIKTIVDFFTANHIKFYIYMLDRRKSGRKIQYQIEITSYHSKLIFIGLVEKYLTKNKEYSRLLKRICEYKLEKYVDWKNGGCNAKNKSGFIVEEIENNFLEEYKKLRDASETTSRIPYKFR